MGNKLFSTKLLKFRGKKYISKYPKTKITNFKYECAVGLGGKKRSGVNICRLEDRKE